MWQEFMQARLESNICCIPMVLLPMSPLIYEYAILPLIFSLVSTAYYGSHTNLILKTDVNALIQIICSLWPAANDHDRQPLNKDWVIDRNYRQGIHKNSRLTIRVWNTNRSRASWGPTSWGIEQQITAWNNFNEESERSLWDQEQVGVHKNNLSAETWDWRTIYWGQNPDSQRQDCYSRSLRTWYPLGVSLIGTSEH